MGTVMTAGLPDWGTPIEGFEVIANRISLSRRTGEDRGFGGGNSLGVPE
jgi:hypothetical protein